MVDTSESRLTRTLFIVEASSFEQLCLWSEHAADSASRRFTPRQWEQLNPGWSVTVGNIGARPVCLSANWARIDGQLVMFWEATSEVVDYAQIKKWLSRHFNGKWDHGTRDATADAMNFHHCLAAIDTANGN